MKKIFGSGNFDTKNGANRENLRRFCKINIPISNKLLPT